MRQWSGIVDIVRDSSPILGPCPIDNLYLNTGFGTGGFKAIPAGGFTMAHTLATGEPHALIKSFGLARFTSGKLLDEAGDRKSTRLNSSHYCASLMPSFSLQPTLLLCSNINTTSAFPLHTTTLQSLY